MKKKTFVKLALSMLLALQLNVCTAEEYQEELTLPVGAAFDLEMDDEINGMDYDAKIIAYEKIDNREVPVLKQAGDTIVTIYFKKENGGSDPVRFLLHSLPPARYEEVTDQHGDVKPEFQHLYDKKAYELRKKKEAEAAAKNPNAKKPDNSKTAGKGKNTNVKPVDAAPINPGISNAPKTAAKPSGPKPTITTGKPSDAPGTNKPAVAAAKPSGPKPIITAGKPEADKPTAKENIKPAAKVEVTPSTPAAPVNNPAQAPAKPVAAPQPAEVQAVYPEKGTFSQQILFLANQERAKNGLAPLEYAESLLRISNTRAEEISGYFSHVRPNGSDFSTIFPDDRAPVAENLGSGRSNAREMFASWLRVPAYRANLLSPDYREMAVGHTFKENTAHKHYWVLLLRG